MNKTVGESVRFIGTINSPLKDISECPLQEYESAPAATVLINPEFAMAAKDIQPGDEIVLLTWLHNSDRSTLQTHPRNNPEAPLTGVFSTRSPDRPNPIGLHVVRVVSVLGNSLNVSGLEVLDQTPVVDIKPVLKTARIP